MGVAGVTPHTSHRAEGDSPAFPDLVPRETVCLGHEPTQDHPSCSNQLLSGAHKTRTPPVHLASPRVLVCPTPRCSARRHRPPHHSCRKPGVTLVPLSHPHLASSRQNLSTCLPVPASWMTVMASGSSPQRPWQEVGLTPPRLFHTLPWPCCPFHFSLQFQAHWFARQPGHRRKVFMVINSSADRNKLSLWNAFQISRARYSCLQTGATARPTVFGWACGMQSCGLGAP